MGEPDIGSTHTPLHRRTQSYVSSFLDPSFVFCGDVRSNNKRFRESRSSLRSPFLGDVNHIIRFYLGAQGPYVRDDFIVELIP